MTITLDYYGDQITLTTEHSASSYGQPVAIYKGEAYGPEDITPRDPYPAGMEWLSEVPQASRRMADMVAQAISNAGGHDALAELLGCFSRRECDDLAIESSQVTVWEHSAECRAIQQFTA